VVGGARGVGRRGGGRGARPPPPPPPTPKTPIPNPQYCYQKLNINFLLIQIISFLLKN